MTIEFIPMSELSPEDALARVTAAFAPAPLAAKRAELADLRARGDTMLFDGAVDWSVFVGNTERRMSGYALNLDDAFADIIACLDHMAESEGAESEVLCTVSHSEDSDVIDGEAVEVTPQA